MLNIALLTGYRPTHLDRPDLEQCGVLIPIFQESDTDRILFTVRHGQLKSHPGEISFPGGKAQPGDVSLAACALREAEEEVSLAPGLVEIVGELDQVIVSGRYLVSPFVGMLSSEASVRPNHEEVTSIITLDISSFLDPPKLEIVSGVRSNLGGLVYQFWVGQFRIWGATARILKQVLELAYGVSYPDPPGA